MELIKLTYIIGFSLIALCLGIILYPLFIKLLTARNFKKTLREEDGSGSKAVIFNKLHAKKAGIPTMGGALFLLVMAIMSFLSRLAQHYGYTNFSIINKQETRLVMIGFGAMGTIGIIDDILNIRGRGKHKGLDATSKIVSTFIVSGFIAYRFYVPLDIDYINMRPFGGEISLGRGAPLIFFLFIVAISNAINFTDGLDGLAGGLMTIVFGTMGILTFMDSKLLTTTILGIMIAILLAFLRYNINPAKVFMGDSGAFAMGGLLSVVLLILNVKTGIFIPFMILFLLFWVELASSALQLFRKKFLKKKLFIIAPFHHQLEQQGRKEHTIVMKARMLQGVLAAIVLILMFYQKAG